MDLSLRFVSDRSRIGDDATGSRDNDSQSCESDVGVDDFRLRVTDGMVSDVGHASSSI